MTIDELCELHLAHAKAAYRKPSGRPTRTANNIRDAHREFRQTPTPDGNRLGLMKVREFERSAPRWLAACQQHMLDSGRVSRRTIKDRVNWIRTTFTWASTLELCDEMTPLRMARIKHLRCPKSNVRPVDWETVSTTMAHSSLKLATMIELMWHTGMRPGELCIMAKSCIDFRGSPWMYEPAEFKTEHFDLDRKIMMGPLAQSVLNTWLPRIRPDCDWLFEGSDGHHPNNQPMREHSFAQSIDRINQKYGIPSWTPNQLRHSAATRIQRDAGIEAARIILGHSSVKTTEIYAERDIPQARRIADNLG